LEWQCERCGVLIVQWFMPFPAGQMRVFIEAVASRPGQSVVGMFSFGAGWGLVRGICAGLGLPYELVRPQEWQGEVLKGQPKGSEYLVASRRCPNADWRVSDRFVNAHSGLVDAALIFFKVVATPAPIPRRVRACL
jgi:hypothetical protein